MRTFEFVEGASSKFYHLSLAGKTLTTRYGRIGTAGQTQEKAFADEAKAQREHDKLVAEKLRKGYTETTPKARAAPASLGAALEAALDDHPDDPAGWMAWADHLAESGDPRGEFAQVQIALEDASRTPAQRKELEAREKELLKKHGKDWLGPLAATLKGKDDVRWARGAVEAVLFDDLSFDDARAL
ncbi:MAG: WGR domain-containing protein, partial [Gemmataceae bacterium]